MAGNKGYFLHDFFKRILPGDRNLFTPILEFIKWRRLTQNLGLLSWVALWLAFCGLLSFSFVQNISVLKGFTDDFAKPPALMGNITEDLLVMEKFKNELLELQQANRNWWIPRLGLTESSKVEALLKKKYITLVKDHFLTPMDRKLEENLGNITSETPGNEVMIYVDHLAARILLTQAHMKGQKFDKSEYVFTILPRVLSILDRGILPEIAAKFSEIYFYYLDWGGNSSSIGSKITELQNALVRIIENEQSTLEWIVDWANSDPRIQDVTLADFWGPADVKNYRSNLVGKRAFTVPGQKRVRECLGYVETALGGMMDVASKKDEFYSWYRKKYIQSWKDFISSFSDGQINLDGADEWQTMTAKMTTPDNPYFDLIEVCSAALKPYAGSSDNPQWVSQLMEVQTIIEESQKERAVKKDDTILSKATREGGRLVQGVIKETRALKDKETVERHIQAAKAFNTYLENLEELLPVSTARSMAYKAASEFFPYSLKPSESKSPFFAAYGEIKKFGTYLQTGGESTVVMQLVRGPLNFLIYYVSMETACSLQHDWEDIVLGGIQGVAPEKMPVLLFGESGAVWKFVNGPATPFLGRNQYGYFAKKARGARIPFKDDFFTFITQGAQVSTSIQTDYKVKVSALPIDVNDDAQKEPYEVALELQCSNGKIRLENFNHPVSQVVTWSPNECGDVTVQIYFEGLVLTKRYAGHDGFPQFLADFKYGSKIFTPDDFPQSKGILQEMKVKEIKVSYEFVDNKPIIKLLEKVPRTTPTVIVNCWDR